MKINAEKIMEKAVNASAGVAVASAFLTVGLIIVKLVEAVSEEAEKHQE